MPPEAKKDNGAGNEPAVELLKEKKEPSLGERNPLLYPPDFSNPEAISALKLTIANMIAEFDGLPPTTLEMVFVPVDENENPDRFVIRFEVEDVTEKQIVLMEKAVRDIYKKAVKTRSDTSRSSLKPSNYPLLEEKQTGSQYDSRTQWRKDLLGWYMGPDTSRIEAGHQGLYLFRNMGSAKMASFIKDSQDKKWFTRELFTPNGKPIEKKYLVEIREGSLYQTDLVKLAIQVASILKNEQPLEESDLIYKIYNRLNRLGISKPDIFGLEEEIGRINRVLILPLANLGLSIGLSLLPESVLLVGVPGTGKTLIAKHFIHKDSGVFFVPIDPLELGKELERSTEKKWIIDRISQIFNETGIPVVVQIDDIENIADEKSIRSSLLNLMAGIRNSGFYVLASTNYPDKMDVQLLQPQRFGHVIYLGLPSQETRRGILEVHANKVSKEEKRELFASEEMRSLILEAIAEHTPDFTARFVAEIVTEAKTNLLARISREKQREIGLTEKDIEIQFALEDWQSALNAARSRYNKKGTKKRDGEIKDFAEKVMGRAGFAQVLEKEGAQLETASLQNTIERIRAEKIGQNSTSLS